MALRTLFFGTSAFALPSLDVVADRTDLAGVVTQPDRPAGRGQHLQPSPVKHAAIQRGIRIYEPEKLRAFSDEIATLDFDCFVVASYGKILPKELLDSPKLGALNVHPSMLPRYRGATPIQATLLAGDSIAGVSIILMDAGMDTGDIVIQESILVEKDDNFALLHDKLANLGAKLLGQVLALGESKHEFPHFTQDNDATVTRPIRKEDLVIDWGWDSQRIINHIRAYSPMPAARATITGLQVKLLAAHVCYPKRSELSERSRAKGLQPALPGTTLGTEGDALLVYCGDDVVALDSVVAPNHARESGAAFARRMHLT